MPRRIRLNKFYSAILSNSAPANHANVKSRGTTALHAVDLRAQAIISTFPSHDVGFICQEGLHVARASDDELVVVGFRAIVTQIANMRGFSLDFVYRVALLAKDLGRAELFLQTIMYE